MSCAKGLVGGRGSSWSLSYFCSTRRFFLIFAFLRRPCVSCARRIRIRMCRLRRSLRGALETYFELFKNITGRPSLHWLLPPPPLLPCLHLTWNILSPHHPQRVNRGPPNAMRLIGDVRVMHTPIPGQLHHRYIMTWWRPPQLTTLQKIPVK